MSEDASYVLLVEDEPKLASLLIDYLRRESYEVQWLSHGNDVVPEVRKREPDLILLDLMLPGTDGLTICRELHKFSEIPIIMVTARVEEVDRLLGLELGADDYICKPFSPREVVARVRAVLRRSKSPEGAKSVGLMLDVDRHAATFHGQPLDLTPAEFRLLHAFVGAPGRVYSRNQLLERIYTDGRVVTDRTVDSHIKNLRKKLDAVRPGEDLIRSIYGVGYKLEL